jgi:hypothetical protein
MTTGTVAAMQAVAPCEKRLPVIRLHPRLMSSKRDGAGPDVVRMRRWNGQPLFFWRRPV